MKTKEYAVYTIEVSNLDPTKQRLVGSVLARHGVLVQYQHQPDDTAISVPRLCTFWRGDKDEKAWQGEIKNAVKKATEGANVITIHAEPWSLLPGYPQGEYAHDDPE